MTRVAALLVALVTVLSANPIMVWYFSEIQVAPDSLERIEINRSDSAPEDLSGWQVVTRAGVATVDSGVVVPPGGYVVIDTGNTTGVFSLGDSSDTIELRNSQGQPEDFMAYPAFGGYWLGPCWTPPTGISCSRFLWVEWTPDPTDCVCWYFDSTPTFGQPNDDTLSEISGFVRDQDSQPVRNAKVCFSCPYGTMWTSTGIGGDYHYGPSGPGTFCVSASCPGYMPGSYPESVRVSANQHVDSIDVLLYSVGVKEDERTNLSGLAIDVRGRTLVLTADRPGTALVTVCDDLGRVRMSENVVLVSGSNEVPLPGFRGGVYFATVQKGTHRSTVKVVLW